MIRSTSKTRSRRSQAWLSRGLQALGLAAALIVISTAVGRAQEAGQTSHDPLAEHLFPPDLVMRHQAEIGLTDRQRQTLIAELQKAQSDMVPLQFEVSEASEELATLVAGERIEEENALARAGRLMELETRVRSRHLTLLIRVKNLLTPEQQERLRGLRGGGG